MFAGLKSGGGVAASAIHKPMRDAFVPVARDFFRGVALAYFGATLTAGIALNSAWLSGADSSPPSLRSAP